MIEEIAGNSPGALVAKWKLSMPSTRTKGGKRGKGIGGLILLSLKLALVTVIIHYLIFGSFRRDAGNFFWPDDVAPWETVDAFYYPDARDPSRFESANGLEDKDQCRSWAQAAALRNQDPDFSEGDYECGIGKLDQFGSVTVYRIIAR